MIALANNGDEKEPESTGGKGELLSDPRHLRRDLRMIHRAIRDDYPIGADGRKWIARRLLKIVRSGGNREAIGAAMALIAADNVNVKREAMDQKDEHAYLPKTHLHVHATNISRLSDDDLERIAITGRFEPGGVNGAAEPSSGEAEPT